uniref:Copper chaperone PCu(A)C n=1 Tax=Candidatus Nitrotoga fabula TaxID=2182327 RepID=A0A2X0QX34_9PROT|nr:conserved protein of unknown function [Candidatus Nitrotoga fabula]
MSVLAFQPACLTHPSRKRTVLANSCIFNVSYTMLMKQCNENFEHGKGIHVRTIIATIVLFFSIQAWAGNVAVSDASARATAPGQDSATIRFSIASQKDGRLVAVSSAIAGAVEIHGMVHESGMMKMRPMDSLPLPAGKTVKLGAGGTHVMLLGLKKPLKTGDIVPLVITVEFADKKQEKVDVNAEVKPLAAGRGGHDHSMH